MTTAALPTISAEPCRGGWMAYVHYRGVTYTVPGAGSDRLGLYPTELMALVAADQQRQALEAGAGALPVEARIVGRWRRGRGRTVVHAMDGRRGARERGGAVNEYTPEPPAVTVRFHLSATNGKEGYEIAATGKATTADVEAAVAAASSARRKAREAIGLPNDTLTDQLAASIKEKQTNAR